MKDPGFKEEEVSTGLEAQTQTIMRNLERQMIGHLGRCFPRQVWGWYSRKARQLGLTGIYVILSFDCDTPEDVGAARDLDDVLWGRGIKRTYAVPGPILEQGADVFGRLAEKGADFINHGSKPHTEWREGRYWSVNFYQHLTSEEVLEDIRRGHSIVEKVTGQSPRGFRVPHFGEFQAPNQLSLLRANLNRLNYRFSTSTVPAFGFRYGPIWKEGGLYEIPLSGSYRSFFTLFDSWNYIISPQQPVVGEEFGEIFVETITRLEAAGGTGILNYYVDPWHVSKSPSFFKAIDYVVNRRIPTFLFGELLDLVEENELRGKEGWKAG